MGLYRRIVSISKSYDKAIPSFPRGFNTYKISGDDNSCKIVIWCSDNPKLNKVDQKTDADLAAAAAALGTVTLSDPNEPPKGTFQILDVDFKTALESG